MSHQVLLVFHRDLSNRWLHLGLPTPSSFDSSNPALLPGVEREQRRVAQHRRLHQLDRGARGDRDHYGTRVVLSVFDTSVTRGVKDVWRKMVPLRWRKRPNDIIVMRVM